VKTILKIILIVQLLLLSSCGVRRIYTSGSYGSLKSYTAKKEYSGERSSEIYVSGDISTGKHEQESGKFKDSKTLMSLSAHKNITGKNYNMYYGMGFTYGNYTFKEGFEDVIKTGEKKSFYNLNFKAGINYTMSRRVIDYRFIGIEFAYNNEFGPYQDKLSQLKRSNHPNLLIINKRDLFSWNLYSEYVFKINKDNAVTLGFYAGNLISRNNGTEGRRANFRGLSFGYRYDRYTFSVVTQSGEADISSTKFGLTYQLF
jgi:hypothetical protein